MSMTLRLGASIAILSLGMVGVAQAQAQAPNTTFFVTSAGSGKGGDLGGLDGADAQCQRLAQTIGAGGKTWRAYLSTTGADGKPGVNARDRIGRGPWQNSKGTVVATSVDDLHSDNNKVGKENSLTERATIVSGSGMMPNWHDILTGSQADGRAFPSNLALTCNNWTSSATGYVAMLGHIDRIGNNPEFGKSWNSTHISRGCSPTDLNSTGGNGLLYCFAQ